MKLNCTPQMYNQKFHLDGVIREDVHIINEI